MSDKKKPTLTRIFIKNLSRGVVKSIPVVGALLEQVIYGTLDSESANKESEKLHSALSQISKKLKTQDPRFIDILDSLNKQVTFPEETAAEMSKIAALFKDPDNAAIPYSFEKAIEATLSLSFEEAIKELTNIVDKIEQDEIPLQDSLDHYERGMALIKHCKTILQKAENRIDKTTKEENTENAR